MQIQCLPFITNYLKVGWFTYFMQLCVINTRFILVEKDNTFKDRKNKLVIIIVTI